MAINVNMASPDGVTLATSGKYCEDNVHVVPTFWLAENAKYWEFTLTGLVNNSIGIVFQDDWLKEHYSDENLCFYCMKQTDRQNVYGNMRVNDISYHGGSSGSCGVRFSDTNTSSTAACFNDTNIAMAGYMYVNSNGELIYKNGSGVYFTDGTYNAIAWLA